MVFCENKNKINFKCLYLVLLKVNHIPGTGDSAFIPVGGSFKIGVGDPLLVHGNGGSWEGTEKTV